MILGIPAYTVLRVFAREFFYNLKAVRKITSSLESIDASAGNSRAEAGTDEAPGTPEGQKD